MDEEKKYVNNTVVFAYSFIEYKLLNLSSQFPG